MRIYLFTGLIALLLITSCIGKTEQPDEKVKIIFDTDLGPDYDDVGALAFLHAMADSGKADIMATIASNKHSLVVPCIEIINKYFGRHDIPAGAPKTAGVDITAWQHWPDSLVAKYPHTTETTNSAEDAVTLYRRLLAGSEDSSVTIITVGFTTNLANLLRSQPDNISDLAGNELVAKKVKLYVAMAGTFPAGKEFNVFMDSVSAEYLFNEWPGKIVFTGFEVGSKIFTGKKLVAAPIENSPVKDVFRISLPLTEEDRNGRMSWDQTAVLIAVYGTEPFFDKVRGNIVINQDGSNTWQDDPKGKHQYVVMKTPPEEISLFIEKRMMHQPVK
jgi:inosine-uridine nucleoside N-ribohydrolase